MNLGIYAIFTGDYKKYFDNYIKSLTNFFPNEHKELIILSDGLTDKDDTVIDDIHIRVREIIDLPYPYINMNKFQFINEFNKKFNFDYIAYFDSDTIFLHREQEFWDYLKEQLLSNKVIVSRHPFYIDEFEYNVFKGRFSDFMKVGSPVYQEREVREFDDRSYINEHFVNDKQLWIITSFFMMSKKLINEYAETIKGLINRCNREFAFLLKLSDETHFNLLYYFDYLNNVSEDRYIINDFIINKKDYQYKEGDDFFICQKYNDLNKLDAKYAKSANLILYYIDENFNEDFLYKIYSKYLLTFNIIFIAKISNTTLLSYAMGRYMARNNLQFWDVWFEDKNILFNKEFYEIYMPEPYNNFLFINSANIDNLNVDFNTLVKENVQYKSDKTLEQNKNFRDISYMYYTKEFIAKNYIDYE